MTNRFLALLIDWRFQFMGTEIVRLIPSGQAERKVKVGGGGGRGAGSGSVTTCLTEPMGSGSVSYWSRRRSRAGHLG